MAIMIPEMPKQFDVRSREGEMFHALEQLPDTYYVFHSFKINTVVDDTVYESEADFIIYHPQKGILCIEAKAGMVSYENGQWLYASGKPMSGDGPFAQASGNKWKLMEYLKNSKAAALKQRLKFLHAVWFPSHTETSIRQLNLPSEADKKLILTGEALLDPTKYIEQIFTLKVPSNVETDLTTEESNLLLRTVLCPRFQVFPSASMELESKRIVFRRLLKEQAHILDFMEEQRTAVINGAAGTGKTVIAVEKAQRHALNGEHVLFLCYNKMLRDHLDKTYHHENIDFNTIHGYCYSLCQNEINFQKMKKKLEDIYFFGSFPYQHVIIDEGQDFGIEEIDDDMIKTLKQLVLDHTEHGTFYVFYDKMQLIQYSADDIPTYIQDADCKMTLYKNCRNTQKIADTSMSIFPKKKALINDETRVNTMEDSVGISFLDDEASAGSELDAMLSEIKKAGYKNIVILTPKTEQTSMFAKLLKNESYQGIPFTTCRKFKGLEADAIVMVDVDASLFEEENMLLFYAGASRARFHLDILVHISDEECTSVIQKFSKNTEQVKKPKREFAKLLKAHLLI